MTEAMLNTGSQHKLLYRVDYNTKWRDILLTMFDINLLYCNHIV
jgi:hypothetical protein